MAFILSNPNGKLRGRVGPLYAKIVKGRNIFCIMPFTSPREYETSQTEKFQKWRTAIKFVKSFKLIDQLHELNEQLRGRFFSGYNAMVSKNVKLTGLDAPTENNTIVVDGFGHTWEDITLTDFDVTASIPPLNQDLLIPEGAVNVSIYGFIAFANPSDPNNEPFVMAPLIKDIPNYNFENPYSLTYSMSTYMKSRLSEYQRITLYAILTIKDANGKILANSKTVAGTF